MFTCSQPDWSLRIPLLKAALTSPEAASRLSQRPREMGRGPAGHSASSNSSWGSKHRDQSNGMLSARQIFTPLCSHQGVMLQMGVAHCSKQSRAEPCAGRASWHPDVHPLAGPRGVSSPSGRGRVSVLPAPWLTAESCDPLGAVVLLGRSFPPWCGSFLL